MVYYPTHWPTFFWGVQYIFLAILLWRYVVNNVIHTTNLNSIMIHSLSIYISDFLSSLETDLCVCVLYIYVYKEIVVLNWMIPTSSGNRRMFFISFTIIYTSVWWDDDYEFFYLQIYFLRWIYEKTITTTTISLSISFERDLSINDREKAHSPQVAQGLEISCCHVNDEKFVDRLNVKLRITQFFDLILRILMFFFVCVFGGFELTLWFIHSFSFHSLTLIGSSIRAKI